MDHFIYRDGALFAEDVAVATIAQAVGTPFYLYSAATLTRHFKVLDDALGDVPHLVCRRWPRIWALWRPSRHLRQRRRGPRIFDR